MIEITLHGQMMRSFARRRSRIAIGCVLVFVMLWLAWGNLQTASAEPPFPQPPVGTRTQLPILSFVGSEATSQTLIQVQNVGSEFTRAIMLVWGESTGACGPQAVGPFKVECSGLIKPGATWMFGEQQVPAGAKSAIIYTFPQEEVLVDDQPVNVADEFCERLLSQVTFDADEFRRFDLAFRQGEDFFGLPTTGGQPVAVDVVRVGQGTPSPDVTVSGAYTGLTSLDEGAFDPVFGSFSYYVPIVYADAAGLTSWLYIQNSGLGCATIDLWFQEQNDCLRAQVCEIFTLAPGETAQYNVSDCVGPSFVGSLWLRTDQPSSVIVDHIGQDVLMTDSAVPAQNAVFASGSEVLFGPLIYREFQGWETSISVQNLSGTQIGAVKVYFYDESGNIITTLVDYVCPRGSQTFFLPVINGLPGQYVGAVRVESLTPFRNAGSGGPFVPIAAVAHLKKYTDPTASQAQEAISYNLFGESKVFDWQLGPGNAGLIGVPSVLKQGRGLSTELAIQNVNPHPGFTDFAIYIYDANGLLEVVCEKLSAFNVEYINFNQWGILNPGFVGSAVISGVFTTQPGGFGLSAVAIQRVQSILQFNTPGDESSGHEASPIFTKDFDFEGPNAPACPGLAACTAVVAGTVYEHDGVTEVPGALLQVFPAGSEGPPIWTGTTDDSGHFTASLPVSVSGSTFEVRVLTQDGRLDVRLTPNPATLFCSSQVVWDLVLPGLHTIEGFAMESCWQVGPDIARLSGARVELWQQTQPGSSQFDKVDETTTDSQGYWKFENVLQSDIFQQEYFMSICFSDEFGSPACLDTRRFLIDSEDTKFWFRYNSETPGLSFWCDGFIRATVTCSGQPVAGVQVGFDRDGDKRADATRVTNAAGEALLDFAGVATPGGLWKVFVDANQNGWWDAGEPFQGVFVEGPETENLVSLTFCPPPPPPPPPGPISVTGTVEDKLSGLPIEGAIVTAANCVDSRQDITDADGNYHIQLNFDPNCTTQVTAGAEGYNPAVDSVFIPEGNTAQITFQLRQTPRSRVLLYYGNGGVTPAQVGYDTLKALFESMGFIVDYTGVWPTEFDWTTKYKLIVLLGPGHNSGDNLTVDGFAAGQVAQLDEFLQMGGTLVVLSDATGFTGQGVENALLQSLSVDLAFGGGDWTSGHGDQVTADCNTTSVGVYSSSSPVADDWTDVSSPTGAANPGVLIQQNAASTQGANLPMYMSDIPSHGGGIVKILGDLHGLSDDANLGGFNWPADNEWVARNWLLCNEP